MDTRRPGSLAGSRSLSHRLRLVGSFAIPTLLVLGFVYLFISLRNGAEAAVADLAGWLPVGYAFAAGMVASVNPCGFLMLPSYLSYHLGTDEAGFDRSSAAGRLVRALLLGSAATAGFIAVFASVGAVIAAGGFWLVRVFPYAGVALGAGMIGLGLWLLFTHRLVGIVAASRLSITPKRNVGNVLIFGIGYAVGSLSCTLPIFLVVVGSALARGDFLTSFGQFIGYALGMGVVLVAVTVGAALFRGTTAAWLRGVIPHVHRTSALFLVGSGTYLVFYWVFYADLF